MTPKPNLAHAPRHDWSARARSTALEALRYTQFVGFMKRALPVAAFAVISAVLAYFFFARTPAKVIMGFEKMGRVENDLAMLKPHLTGQDAKGNPFVITADAAVQDAKNPKRASLTRVEADFTLQNNGWLNAEAASGLVDMTAGALSLQGGIAVFSDQGYELHTDNVSVDLNKGLVRGPVAVTGHGPLGDLRADHFEFDRTSKILTLEGNVRMRLVGGRT